MKKLDHLWNALETVPGLALPRLEWAKVLGPDLEIAQRFLRPTDNHARFISCPFPGGDNCPRRVVEHEGGDTVAVCGNHPSLCESLALCRDDAIIHEFDLGALASSMAPALGVASEPALCRFDSQLWNLGTNAQGSVPVYLALSVGERFRNSTAKLLAGTSDSLFLLTPTPRRMDALTTSWLSTRHSRAVSLADLLLIDTDGSFTGTTLDEHVAARRRPIGQAENRFQKTEAGWSIVFDGCAELRFDDLKGLRLLAVLLKNPGREFHPWEIENEAGESFRQSGSSPERSQAAWLAEGENELEGRAGDLALDDDSLKLYRERLEDIDQRLAEANDHNDLGTIDSLQCERAWLMEGLRTEVRRPDRGKQVRDRTTNALKYSLKKLVDQSPVLAEHFTVALRQGPTWCYRAEHAASWLL